MVNKQLAPYPVIYNSSDGYFCKQFRRANSLDPDQMPIYSIQPEIKIFFPDSNSMTNQCEI